LQNWFARQADLAALSARQIFFIGGAPRSGTTWLQQMLDCHPDISCQGEGLFQNALAAPLERMIAERTKSLDSKNTSLFRHTGGYPLPDADDVEFLLGAAILLALRRQSAGTACHAVGEKTPENVFLFPRLKRLFPDAKFIAIARDPRDVLTSAWHFFGKPAASEDTVAARMAFIRLALPSLGEGARAMIAGRSQFPADYRVVTYEALCSSPEPVLADLFRFLGVTDTAGVVADCVCRTEFARQTGGRAAGVEQNSSFFRKGVVGDWRSTLTPEMNDLVLHVLGWTFPHFGWDAAA
jgi:hypothetical protein